MNHLNTSIQVKFCHSALDGMFRTFALNKLHPFGSLMQAQTRPLMVCHWSFQTDDGNRARLIHDRQISDHLWVLPSHLGVSLLFGPPCITKAFRSWLIKGLKRVSSWSGDGRCIWTAWSALTGCFPVHFPSCTLSAVHKHNVLQPQSVGILTLCHCFYKWS